MGSLVLCVGWAISIAATFYTIFGVYAMTTMDDRGWVHRGNIIPLSLAPLLNAMLWYGVSVGGYTWMGSLVLCVGGDIYITVAFFQFHDVLWAVLNWLDSMWILQTPDAKLYADPNNATNDPIDLVFTWVDSSDAEWKQLKAQTLGTNHKCIAGAGQQFFPDPKYPDAELELAVRSAMRHLSWVRQIYIVTIRPQIPTFLKGMPNARICIVHHDEIGIDRPVFNSLAIEPHLHKIPNISNQFLYSNDDCYICKDLDKNDFFTQDGYPLLHGFFRSRTHMKMTTDWGIEPATYTLPLRDAMDQLGTNALFIPHHMPYPMNVDVMAKLSEKYAERWYSNEPFRSTTDLSTLYLATNDSLQNRRAFISTRQLNAMHCDEWDGQLPSGVCVLCINHDENIHTKLETLERLIM